MNKMYVSFPMLWEGRSPGISIRNVRISIIIIPINPVICSVLSPSLRAVLKAAWETMQYTIVAQIVEISTIHPIAVLPRKGINTEHTTTATMALLGESSTRGTSPSLLAELIRRLSAIIFPIRLVRITANKANIRMITPGLPKYV